jgi:hypothetical protein
MSRSVINLNHNCLQEKIKTRETGVTMINSVQKEGRLELNLTVTDDIQLWKILR